MGNAKITILLISSAFVVFEHAGADSLDPRIRLGCTEDTVPAAGF